MEETGLNSCRTCLGKDVCISLFDQEYDTLANKVMACARVRVVWKDGFPESICSTCAGHLEIAYKFKEQCEKSDAKLRKILDEQYICDRFESQDEQTIDNFDSRIKSVNDDTRNSPELSNLGKGDKRITAISTVSNKKENTNLVIIDSEKPINYKIQAKKQHVQTVTQLFKTKNSLSKMSVKKKNASVRESKVNAQKHQCHTCGKVFNKCSQLKVHLRTHTGEKPFTCLICEKAFRVQHHLQAHSRIHTSERPYQCLHCGKCFTESSSLRRHTKIHTNDKKFSCPQCPKCFISPNDVRKHIVRHTGEKPFHCTSCQKRYSDPSSLTKHFKKHQQCNLPETSDNNPLQKSNSYDTNLSNSSYKFMIEKNKPNDKQKNYQDEIMKISTVKIINIDKHGDMDIQTGK